MRTIMAAIGSTNNKVAKILSLMSVQRHIVLHHCMVSFDVESLLNMVELDQTLEIRIQKRNRIYGNPMENYWTIF